MSDCTHRAGGITMSTHKIFHVHVGITAIVLASMCSVPRDTSAANDPPGTSSTRPAWRDGSARYDFAMDEQTLAITSASAPSDEKVAAGAPIRCILVVPEEGGFPAIRGPGETCIAIISPHPRPNCSHGGSISRTSHPGQPGRGKRGAVS